jgi:flagellar basal body-associated protein FliL
MKKINLIVLSVLTTVLLSSSFFAIAAADEDTPDSTGPNELVASDQAPTPDPSDNSTRTQDDNQAYHILDDEAPLIAPAPGQESENGLAAENSSDNSAVAIAIGAVLAVIVGSVIGLMFFRKQAKKAKV